jgi:hypothetical protein
MAPWRDRMTVMTALPADQRPLDHTPIHTEDLPATPIRDRNIPATAWIEAPTELRDLGYDLSGQPVATYKRRIGQWLLWRAGPATHAEARYWAAAAGDLADQWTFRLEPDGTGAGIGPSGTSHHRFRTWKEDLRDRQDPPRPSPPTGGPA